VPLSSELSNLDGVRVPGLRCQLHPEKEEDEEDDDDDGEEGGEGEEKEDITFLRYVGAC
jgi:hypothetical protein